MTATFSAREKLFYIIDRLRRERKLTWRKAWEQVAGADKELNGRELFPTFGAFTIWRKRYEKVYPPDPENEIKIEEMHNYTGISEGAYIPELVATRGMHVSQWNGSGKDWLDREEAEYEKRLERQLARSHSGKRTK
jgi:hypothetical protein